MRLNTVLIGLVNKKNIYVIEYMKSLRCKQAKKYIIQTHSVTHTHTNKTENKRIKLSRYINSIL